MINDLDITNFYEEYLKITKKKSLKFKGIMHYYRDCIQISICEDNIE
jgi:hypothetical protein